MTDIQKLKKAIRNFEFYSTPSSGTSSDPCTVGDIKKVVNKTAELFSVFVEELERD